MRRPLLLTEGAATDLEDLYRFAVENYLGAQADRLLRQLAQLAFNGYAQLGLVPPELRELGLADYRQAVLRPYRAIYRIRDTHVIVYIVADVHRDLQSLLGRRMLAP